MERISCGRGWISVFIGKFLIIFALELEIMGDVFLVVLGLALLMVGADLLLRAAVSLSLWLSVPKIVIGMTVVSFATSVPELIVSVNSALEGFPDLAMANAVGSNIVNLGLILAITIIVGGIEVQKSFYTTDWPIMMLASLLVWGFVYFDGVLQQNEGIILLCTQFLFLIYLLRYQRPAVVDEMPEDDRPLPMYKMALFFGIGGAALWGGSDLLIDGAVGLASTFGVNDRIIGVTLVAVGTGIPELAASLLAVMKKEKAISLGNLIGSNIFNLLTVLGITSLIAPIRLVDQDLRYVDLFWMLGISFLILPLVFFPKGLRLGWRDGLVLLAVYGMFLYTTLK